MPSAAQPGVSCPRASHEPRGPAGRNRRGYRARLRILMLGIFIGVVSSLPLLSNPLRALAACSPTATASLIPATGSLTFTGNATLGCQVKDPGGSVTYPGSTGYPPPPPWTDPCPPAGTGTPTGQGDETMEVYT